MPEITERIEITAAIVDVTVGDGNGASFADIWALLVPINQKYTVTEQDSLSCYLVGDDTVEMPANTKVRVVKKSIGRVDSSTVTPIVLYSQLKEFADIRKLFFLGVNRTVIGPGEYLILQVAGADVAGTGDTDGSASSFKITATRTRPSLM